MAGDIFNDVRVRHSGNVVGDVIEGSFTVLDNLQQLTNRIDSYKAITLDDREQSAFAEAAAELRWGRDESTGNLQAPLLYPNQLIRANRYEDRHSDLWTVFNRVQENMIKGGLAGRSATGRRTRTREVGGVNENVKLNRALWTMADRLAQFKSSNDPQVLIAA